MFRFHTKYVQCSLQLNFVPERMNRSLLNTVRIMLLGAPLDQKFWGESFLQMVFLKNVVVSREKSSTTNEILTFI